MVNTWRKLGLTYIHYSNIAAQTLRSVLLPEFQKAAEIRNRTTVRFTRWENGKPIKKTIAPKT